MTQVAYNTTGLYRYNPKYLYRLESTDPSRSKRDMAKAVYNALKEKGMLRAGATEEQMVGYISEHIGDSDSDGFFEVDVKGLVKDGRIVKTNESASKITQIIIANVPKLVRFLPDPPKSHPHALLAFPEVLPSFYSSARNAPDLKEVKKLLKSSEVQELMKKLSSGPNMPVLNKDFSVGEAMSFFQYQYLNMPIKDFNDLLHRHFAVNFVHLADSGLPGARGSWNVNAVVDMKTRRSAFSHTRDGKARIDCDIYAQMAFLYLSKIKGKDGQPAFECKIVDMKGHAILVYTERASGRTFVLSNDEITEVPPGMTYKEYLSAHFRGTTYFHEFDSIENYPNDKWSAKISLPRIIFYRVSASIKMRALKKAKINNGGTRTSAVY